MTASVAVMATTAYMPGMEPIRSMVAMEMIRSSQALAMIASVAVMEMTASVLGMETILSMVASAITRSSEELEATTTSLIRRQISSATQARRRIASDLLSISHWMSAAESNGSYSMVQQGSAREMTPPIRLSERLRMIPSSAQAEMIVYSVGMAITR